MTELNELKKKFSELLELGRALVKSIPQKLCARLPHIQTIRSVNLNVRIALAAIVVCLAFGFFVGFMVTKINVEPQKNESEKRESPFSWFRSLFMPQVDLKGNQPDGSFLISNFERPDDVGSWKLIAAQIVSSTNYAWEGTQSGQVSFLSGKELSAITLDDIGKSRTSPSDWSDYDFLQFYVFQPGSHKEELTLMVSDVWGKHYQEKLNIPPASWGKYSITINKMRSSIDTRKINQISISRRQTDVAQNFYFDDIRLIPSATAAGGLRQVHMFDYGFADRKPAWVILDAQINAPVVHIPFIVKNETNAFCHLCPVEGGIPFPIGELHDAHALRIRNPY